MVSFLRGGLHFTNRPILEVLERAAIVVLAYIITRRLCHTLQGLAALPKPSAEFDIVVPDVPEEEEAAVKDGCVLLAPQPWVTLRHICGG